MKNFNSGLKTVAAAALACTALVGHPTIVLASEEAEFDGSKLRVHLSEKLTTLSQHIASASCRLGSGINAESASQELARAQAQFNRILDGLENGSEKLGVPSAETHHAALESIRQVRESWGPINAAASSMVETGGKSGNDAIAAGNLGLLEATEVLASDVSGLYANPRELQQVDALALHFASRQPMLAHKMAKETCGIGTNQAAYGTSDDLDATVKLFSLSQDALANGMPAVGLRPPPTEVVSDKLALIEEYWSQNLPALKQMASGAKPSADNVDTVARLSAKLETDMKNVTTSYMIAAPGSEEIYRGPILDYAQRELVQWIKDPQLIEAIRQQNAESKSLSQAEIDRLDGEWRAQIFSDNRPMVEEMLGRPASRWMIEEQEKMALFVDQVIAMDNRGINVAQSDLTEMYWQGGLYTFQETYLKNSTGIHIGEIEFDEAAQAYHSHVSMTVVDPDTGESIGAITFGVDVQSLL